VAARPGGCVPVQGAVASVRPFPRVSARAARDRACAWQGGRACLPSPIHSQEEPKCAHGRGNV